MKFKVKNNLTAGYAIRNIGYGTFACYTPKIIDDRVEIGSGSFINFVFTQEELNKCWKKGWLW